MPQPAVTRLGSNQEVSIKNFLLGNLTMTSFAVMRVYVWPPTSSLCEGLAKFGDVSVHDKLIEHWESIAVCHHSQGQAVVQHGL